MRGVKRKLVVLRSRQRTKDPVSCCCLGPSSFARLGGRKDLVVRAWRQRNPAPGPSRCSSDLPGLFLSEKWPAIEGFTDRRYLLILPRTEALPSPPKPVQNSCKLCQIRRVYPGPENAPRGYLEANPRAMRAGAQFRPPKNNFPFRCPFSLPVPRSPVKALNNEAVQGGLPQEETP